MARRISVPTPAPGGGGSGQRAGKKPFTTAEFIAKAQAAHGVGAYDYSQVVYLNKRQKVKIVCPIHGLFEQNPHSHWLGKGCLRCGNSKAGQTRTLTTADFVAQAQALWGVGTYDYAEAVYTGYMGKITIICPVHGRFEVEATRHIFKTPRYRAGCQLCGFKRAAIKSAQTANKEECIATLYLIRLYDKDETFYKVGITTNKPSSRAYKIKSQAGYTAEVLATYHATDFGAAYDWEQSILRRFAHLRYDPQKHFNGNTECFSSCDEILTIFPT